jgi:hypothetical protein
MHRSNGAARSGWRLLHPLMATERRRSPEFQETTMELVNRLNVLAALTSFAFLAAVVLGMV